LVYTGWSG